MHSREFSGRVPVYLGRGELDPHEESGEEVPRDSRDQHTNIPNDEEATAFCGKADVENLALTSHVRGLRCGQSQCKPRQGIAVVATICFIIAVVISVVLLSVFRSAPHFEHRIANLVEGVSEHVFFEHVTQLSGESSASAIATRWSQSSDSTTGISLAVHYVKEKMEEYGFEVELHVFDKSRGPNVISTLRGTRWPDELVVLGAHLDDGPSVGRAPGANDNGSGAAALLAIAETLHRKGVALGRTLVLEHYMGEEQDLGGSRALAKRHRERQDAIVGMLNQDMTAWHGQGDPLGVAFVQGSNVDRPLTDFCEQIARLYADARLSVHNHVLRNKRQRLSALQCCSDHESYADVGYATAGYLQPRGYTSDKTKHTSGDLVHRKDFDALQATLIARVVLAAAAHLAEIDEWSWGDDDDNDDDDE